MKAKYFFSTLALLALLVSCSKKEFTPATVYNDSNLVEVGENFFVAMGRADEVSTKTNWNADNTGRLEYYWIPSTPSATYPANAILGGGATKNVNTAELGFCWTGSKGDDELIALSNNVYSNYKFTHNGWLSTKAAKAEVDPCPPHALSNGWLYSEATDFNMGNELGGATGTFAVTVTAKGIHTTPNYKTGIFSTENLSLFGGNYIVYYPYTTAFSDNGPIIASSPVEFTNVEFATGTNLAGLRDPMIGRNTFSYKHVRNLVGGQTAEGFSLTNLSGIVRLKVSTLDDCSGITIDKIALINGNFVKSVAIGADKIVNGDENIYCGTPEYSNSIIFGLANPIALTDEDSQCLYFPALPTDGLANLEAVIYGTATVGGVANTPVVARVPADMDAIKGNDAKLCEVVVEADDFKANVYYVTDAATWDVAVNHANNSDVGATINLLSDVNLAAATETAVTPNAATLAEEKDITISGDGSIIVPADIILTLNTGANVESKIVVLGEPCCAASTDPGKLVVNNAIVKDVDILGAQKPVRTGRDAGVMEIGKTNVAYVLGNVLNEGTIDFIVSDTDNTPSYMALYGTITNNGTVNITKSANANADSKLEIMEGASLLNNSKVEVKGVLVITGTIKNNAGAYIRDYVSSQVTGAIAQLFDAEGEYISDVDNVTDRFNAALNKRPTTILNFVTPGTPAPRVYDMTKFNNKVAPIDQVWVSDAAVTFSANADAGTVLANRVANLDGIDLFVKANLIIAIDNLNAKSNKGLSKITFNNVTVENDAVMTISAYDGTNYNSDKATNAFIANDVVVAATGTKLSKLLVGRDIFAKVASIEVKAAAGGKKGYFVIENNAEFDVCGQITVAGAANINIATGDTSNIAGIVWYPKAGPAPKGNANWENGTPTQHLQ